MGFHFTFPSMISRHLAFPSLQHRNVCDTSGLCHIYLYKTYTIGGMNWGRSPCHMSIIRNGNLAMSNQREPHVIMSILRKRGDEKWPFFCKQTADLVVRLNNIGQ